VAIHEAADAATKVNDTWMRLADVFGRDTEWGSGLCQIVELQKKSIVIEESWARTLEEKFVMPMTVTLGNEIKQLTSKDNDVKKALKKYEGVMKTVGNRARKESKKGDSIVSAMNELNDTAKDVDEKREKIWQDVQSHCAQLSWIFMRALSSSIREKIDQVEKNNALCQQFKGSVDAIQKLQPSKSQVKSEDLTILYSDVDDVPKERKGTLRRGTLSKRSAAVMAKDIADNSLSPPTLSGQSSPRSANNSPRGTATPSLSGAPSRGPPTIRVRARWAFNAEREGELSMAAGDVLSITDKTSQNWWMAELNGKRGVIPANYIEVLAEQVDEPPPLPPPSSSLETKADSSIKLASSSSDPRSSRSQSAGAQCLPQMQPPTLLPPPLLTPVPPQSYQQPPTSSPSSIQPIFEISLQLPPTLPVVSDEGSTGPIESPSTPEALPPPPADDPPQEWQQFFTVEGHAYLYNARTGESRWA